jgi:glucokinase
MKFLAGDIGGTKTVIAAYSSKAGVRAPICEERYPSQEYPDLEAILHKFLAAHKDIQPEAGVFGVAGPVIQGQAQVTNVPWLMDEKKIKKDLGFKQVKLLNDLAAVAQAIPALQDDERLCLHAGERDIHGNIAIIAPGTGLGEAFLTWQDGSYRVHSSEGGHVSFAPTDATEVRLLLYMMERYEHVSYERVCSGLGIPNIYAFVKDSDMASEPEWLRERLASASDPTPVIIQAAQENDEEKRAKICEMTLDLFVSILGEEAGNLAIKVMATGGIFIGGGIPPRIIPALQSGRLLQALHTKGRFGTILQRIPVYAILNPDAALLGAACYEMATLSKSKR